MKKSIKDKLRPGKRPLPRGEYPISFEQMDFHVRTLLGNMGGRIERLEAQIEQIEQKANTAHARINYIEDVANKQPNTTAPRSNRWLGEPPAAQNRWRQSFSYNASPRTDIVVTTGDMARILKDSHAKASSPGYLNTIQWDSLKEDSRHAWYAAAEMMLAVLGWVRTP